MTIITDDALRDRVLVRRTNRSLMTLGSAFKSWYRRRRSARELATQLDRLDTHRLEDIGLVRRTRQIGWTPAARGSDPMPLFHSTYEPGEAQ